MPISQSLDVDPQDLISVCIPAFNNAAFIAATLESVLHQTHHHLEIIITDDLSTDGTVATVRRFSDARIRLVQNEANLGFGGNWNKALSLATGTYIKLLCADDLVYPDCLRRQREALEDPAHSGAVLAICNSDLINANSQVIYRRRVRCGTGLVNGRQLIRRSVRWGTNLIGEPAAGLFRREVLSRAGLFDPGNPYLIDLAFWAALLRHGDAFVDQSRLAAFRISAGAMSTKLGWHQAASFRRFIGDMRADPFHRASAADAALGCLLSFQWCILRNLLISFQTRKTRRES
jgi:glycosyltransferase involved in cell wall biosynthesis